MKLCNGHYCAGASEHDENDFTSQNMCRKCTRYNQPVCVKLIETRRCTKALTRVPLPTALRFSVARGDPVDGVSGHAELQAE